MTGFLTILLVQVALAYFLLASFLCLLLAAELAWPRGVMPSFRERWTALQFTLILIPALILFQMIGARARNAAEVGPFLGLGSDVLPIALGGLLYIFAYDFFYYWFHRAQHAVPLLWRFHAVHHSNEHLAAGFGFHHLAEAPLRAALVGLPLGMLVDGPGGLVISYIYTIHGYYVHSSTRLNFGALAWLIGDNRVHRIHHSLEPRHFDKNFGVSTLLWDKLFGTAYWPKDEWPKVGLADVPQPKNVREYLSGINVNSPAIYITGRPEDAKRVDR